MSTFNYNQDIPNGPNNPSADQPLMKTNTNSIHDILDVDHYTFESSNQDGYHKVIRLPSQTTPPSIGTIGQFYAQQVTSGGNNDEALFYQTGGGRIFQLTSNPGGAGPLLPTAGYSFLPGGLIIQWGSTTAVQSASTTTVNYPIAFPTAVLSVQCTIQTNDNSTIRFSLLNNPGTTTFATTQTTSSSLTKMYWMAIGY